MKRVCLLVLLSLFPLAGFVWAQSAPDMPPLFIPLRQIGELRPQGILYDPNYDRFAWVDSQQQLLLVDATSYQTQHVLYENGTYNAYQFSHDGRWLALAIDRRIELWETQTGQRAAVFAPTGANLVQGPLHFTPDNAYLLLDTVVPAPQELRRSENDTSIIPWLWDLAAARGERSSRYASAEDGYAFFEYRNGLVIGAHNILIGGIPNRLMIIDGQQNTFPVVAEIQANRFERDPMTIWQSASDDLLYADPMTGSGIVQVDTARGSTFNIPLGRDYNYRNVPQLDGLRIANNGRVLCPNSGTVENSLLSLIYGPGYLSYQNYEPQTFMLLDVLVPITTTQNQTALLMYATNVLRGRGSIELIHPQDVQQTVLSPDRTRLMVRRASGKQPIEVYNLKTCTLERTLYPAEPDGSGQHILAFNADGSEILSDFQRFDTYSGEMLAHVVNYTQGFEQYAFGEDSRTIDTIRGNVWQAWNIETGQPLQRTNLQVNTEVIDQSDDASRYLLRIEQDYGITMVIADFKQHTRRSLDIPNLPDLSLQQIIPSATWENFLVVYTTGRNDNDLAVYNFESGQRLFVAGDDLPANSQQYGWIDAHTVYAAGAQSGGETRIYGIDYDVSGLPACLVQAFPNDYITWLPLWEALNYRLSSTQLARLSQRLCASLPASAEGFTAALTPTAPFSYRSNPTPLPYAIPGVPQCLTERFTREAIDYSALWRQMSEGLDESQRAELETMICEGLISSVGGVQPTPTIDPNLDVPPTPTPIDAAPQTTGGGPEYRPRIIAIDIETGQRSEGDYLPPSTEVSPPDTGLLYNFFYDQFRRQPNHLQVSPDGRLAAELDPNGFVLIYRLSRTLDEIQSDEADAAATRDAQAVRSIGLIPSPTQPYRALGDIRPTLTPTITPTPPPMAKTTAEGWQPDTIIEVCPADHLFRVDQPPVDYAAVGRLFAAPPASPDAVWVLEPEDGRLYADDSLPRCTLGENCTFSFDRQWLVRILDRVIVSRPDGAQATILADNPNYFPDEYTWQPDDTLTYRTNGYLPDVFRGQGEVLRDFDPATGVLSTPYASPDVIQPVKVGDLPTTVIANRPGGSLAVVSTPYGANNFKYSIYDRSTGLADYFARSDGTPITAFWHPTGKALYYFFDSQTQYVYDPQTHTHALLPGGMPGGIWSPNGRYTLRWFAEDRAAEQARIAAGKLPLKLELWDSQTGVRRRYCLPETHAQAYGENLLWSPDGRYVAFVINLPIGGDYFPTPGPTPVPYTPEPTLTPVPLETQYDYQFPRTIVLDTQTGTATILSKEIRSLILWTDDGGER